MKKIIALIFVLIFVFTLSACKNKDTASDTNISAPTSSEAFVKPENYATVLLVSINPQFKLYLDESNKVLAVEPVNEDAKSFYDNIDFENKSVEAVVENIIEKANEKGFVKENAVVNFEITEQKDGIDNNDILTTVISAANQKATELKIEIKVETSETSSKNEGSTSKPTTSTEPAEGTPTESSKPTHTHSYSAATCTAPQKCSCGETKGTALGHSYKYFVCTVCKEEQKEGQFVNLKDYYWKYGVETINKGVPGKEDWPPYALYLYSLDFKDSYCDYSSCFSFQEPKVITDIHSAFDSPFVDEYARIYNKKYYSMAASGYYAYTYAESNNKVTITLTSEYGGGTITLNKQGFNQLVVVSNTASQLSEISVGSVFTAYPRWEKFY